ncbi:MAG: deoxynucleoside kinase [Chlorobi bacterium]|nr:deoxynucleoside kinase [Chlorobiota bacterium]
MVIPDTNIRYIAIEGVIGAGKTSLARLLRKEIGGQLILEKFEENPFLERFYQDPRRYAFQTQIFFLVTRFKQLQQVLQPSLFDDFIISDYTFDKDRIFADLNLNPDEMALYNMVASQLQKSLVTPDLVVYLQSSVDRLMENIAKRGRSFEHNMSREYIESLNEAYNYYFFRYKASPLLIVKATDIDFVENKRHLEDLIHAIMRPNRVAMEYFTPLGDFGLSGEG